MKNDAFLRGWKINPRKEIRDPAGIQTQDQPKYSEGLGFESQLDPGSLSVDLFFTLSAKTSLHPIVGIWLPVIKTSTVPIVGQIL